MKRIAITGIEGTIGKVLKKGLAGFEITPIDFPDVDVRDYKRLLDVFPGHDAVVH